MNVKTEHTDTFIEFDLYNENDEQIGTMEIEPNKKELCRLVIWKPYRNKGYGKKAVEKAIRDYGVTSLWVRSDNQEAIKLYEMCGFKRDKEVMFQMTIDEEKAVSE